MSMPWQLRNCNRPPPGKSRRPIVEQLPSISVNDLPIPRDYKTYTMPNVSLRYPQLSGIRISGLIVEFHIPSPFRGREGLVQTFRLKHIKTGFGIRHAFICTCGRPVIKLYYCNRHLACRRCSNARYASQTLNKQTRPVLQASRIESFLDNKPRLFRHTRERLKKRLGDKLMMAQGCLGTAARSLWK
jgi:hypothetical protein